MNLLQAIACTRGGLDSQILFWFNVSPTTLVPVLNAWHTIHAEFPLVAACFLVPRRGNNSYWHPLMHDMTCIGPV